MLLVIQTRNRTFCFWYWCPDTRALWKLSELYLLSVRHWTRQNNSNTTTVYPKKYAHGFCFAVLCCGYTLTDFPISIRLTSLAPWQSSDCPSASKATLMNMDKYFIWIHYERLHNHNKAKHNKTVCIFLGIYCMATAVHNQGRGLGKCRSHHFWVSQIDMFCYHFIILILCLNATRRQSAVGFLG